MRCLSFIIFAFLISCKPHQNPLPSLAPDDDNMPSQHAFLGVSFEAVKTESLQVQPKQHALKINTVLPGTSAEQAGLQVNDFIVSYDGIHFDKLQFDEMSSAFSQYVKSKPIGHRLKLEVVRQTTLVRKNQEDWTPVNTDELVQQLEGFHLQKNQEWTIRTQAQTFQITPVLKGRFLKKTKKTKKLFWLKSDATIQKKLNQFLNIKEAQNAYDDLLQRFKDDEASPDDFRLSAISLAHRDPTKLKSLANQFNIPNCNHNASLPELIGNFARLLDAPLPKFKASLPPQSDQMEEHLTYLLKIVEDATKLKDLAFSQLSLKERLFLKQYAPLLVQSLNDSFFLNPKSSEEFHHVLNLMKKIDFARLFSAQQTLSQLTHQQWLGQLQSVLKQWEAQQNQENAVLLDRQTAFGRLVIGSSQDSHYEQDIAILIDLGGNDLYMNNAGSARSDSIALLIDLAGDDEYSATSGIAQGSALLGLGLLIDLSGNDRYRATHLAQGSAILGGGLLIDLAGDDDFTSEEFAQASGFGAIAILWDQAGDDRFRSHYLAQGVGTVQAVGALVDCAGDDEYFASGKWASSYGREGAFRGASQGFGLGLRGYASGGFGVLFDGAGKDTFEAGNFSQGGGYFFAMGLLHNAGEEQDFYLGERYAQGFSAHSALGVLIEEGGDDQYRVKISAGQAMSWDLSAAMLLDYGGNDRYLSKGQLSQGAASQNGFAWFEDFQGEDTYSLPFDPAPKSSGNEYHGGQNLSIMIEYGNQSPQKTGGIFGIFSNTITTESH